MVDSEVECLPASEESPWNCHFSLLSQLFCFVLDYEEEHKYVEWYRNRSIQDTGRLCKAKHRKAFLTGYQGTMFTSLEQQTSTGVEKIEESSTWTADIYIKI
uniref:Bm9632, isoform a n=1 Tax=Brugia malayi TaxID=6279 RepID=A0A1I9G1T8_BRUMA|nr:Bm9632, isoform a [Brugia malayi]